jgi:hypothetical protein
MDKKQTERKTLTEGDIETDERAVGRRKALGILGIGVLGGAVAVTGALGRPQTAHAKANDSDSGDPAGRGRTGHTDRDTGAQGDQPGRGVCAERGHSDSDSGSSGDPAGRGRGPCR